MLKSRVSGVPVTGQEAGRPSTGHLSLLIATYHAFDGTFWIVIIKMIMNQSFKLTGRRF